MWPFASKPKDVFITNTLSGAKETFIPLHKGKVRLYSCGPTVYGPQHIGNMRSAVFSDVLYRTLSVAGYHVQKVVNITDVGHLVGDGDEGEDKMSVGAKREQVSPKAIANKYAKQYLDDIRALNIDTRPIRFPRATDYITDQIKMIKTLERAGHTYILPDGVYFDTSTFKDYGKLGKRNEAELQAGARVEMVEGKRNPQDFVLWRMAKPGDLQQWNSPWGRGNPGWSIECSAMSKALLGTTLDIHTGGEDHISVHHNNEIAQSEGANEKPLARYWMHHAFLTIDGQKIAKSLGNAYVLQDVRDRHIDPLALRYFFLQAHYRTPLSFTWESLEAAEGAYRRLRDHAKKIAHLSGRNGCHSSEAESILVAVRDDLATPKALARVWELIQDDSMPSKEKWRVLEIADAVLGLDLTNPKEEAALPEAIQALVQERDAARAKKDYATSDTLRKTLEDAGYIVKDSETGTHVEKR